MISKTSIALIAWMTLGVATSPSQGQFGGFFGGTKVETISTADLNEWLMKEKAKNDQAKDTKTQPPPADFIVVDVRSDAETRVSIIPGAVTKMHYEKNREQYKGRMVIPYCTVGGRSGAYAKKLAKNGIKVKNYKGSILKWVGAGLPVVTLDGNPTNRVHTYSKHYRIPAKYDQVTE